MASKKKSPKVLKAPASEGREFAKSLGRGGFMAHKLTKRKKTRGARDRAAIREYTP